MFCRDAPFPNRIQAAIVVCGEYGLAYFTPGDQLAGGSGENQPTLAVTTFGSFGQGGNADAVHDTPPPAGGGGGGWEGAGRFPERAAPADRATSTRCLPPGRSNRRTISAAEA